MNRMSHVTRRALSRLAQEVVVAACLAAAATAALAGPGAHGPNGEHLDEKPAAAAGHSRPRLEAHSELFELVARLDGGALTILVDRYETNEPVLGARLEVESGSLKASATFRPGSGDYAVTDAGMLKGLAEPGEHALVFTLVAGDDADLLDGTLVTVAPQAAADDDGHDHALERALWIGAGAAGLMLIGAALQRRLRRDRRAGSAAKSGRVQSSEGVRS